MVGVSVTAVRQQIATHLATGYGLTRESPEPVAFMRAPTRSPVHLEFGVGMDNTRPVDGRKDLVASDVRVLIAYQLAPKDRVSAYDAMLTFDTSIVNAMQLSAWSNGPRLAALVWQSTSRTPAADGWIWIEQLYTAIHLLA
jgi:hypothetical protein